MGVGLVGGVLVTCILCTRLGMHFLDAHPVVVWSCDHHLLDNLRAIGVLRPGQDVIVRSVTP